ncbi:MAG: hypothetical protein NUV63_05225 [Gallionella sp.]|nr:hypothetical protein [Gallionella sp.]
MTYVSDQTGIAGFGAARITVAAATSDINGVGSFAVPAGSYTAQLSALPANLVTGENAAYYSTETVTTSGVKTYQADQYGWVITSPVPLSSVQISVYQTDSAGLVDRGSYTNAVDPTNATLMSSLRNPIVFDRTTALASATTTTETIELFKGNYKLVIRGTPVSAADVLAPYITSMITVAGGGLTVSNPITLAAPSKAPTITLKDTAGAALAGYTVDFYESTNKILLGSSVTDALGVASVGAPSGVTGVVAVIYDTLAAYKGVYIFSDINASFAATLQQYTVTGQLQASVGALNSTNTPTVYARTDTTLGRWADSANVASATAAAGTGTYTLTLFGGTPTALSYKISATNVTDFPDVAKVSIAVSNANLANQNIAVTPGGVILGRIQTEGKVDLPGVTVYIYGTAADGIIDLVNSTVTDATGSYSLQVPNGTYFLLVNGAVTDGLSVSAAAPTVSKNLTQFSMTGQVSKNLGTTTTGASLATVVAGFQTATASSLGVYTINVMEGKNWICASPSAANDPTYGYSCTLNVLVDATTVAAARL